MTHLLFLILLGLLIYVNLIIAQNFPKVSPRATINKYLNDNGCKNRLLNKMLLHTLVGREEGISYPMLRDMIIKHIHHVKEPELYKCYQVLINKFVLETGYRRYEGILP